MSDHALQAFLDDQDALHDEHMEHLEDEQILKEIPELFRQDEQRELFIEDYAMARAGGRR